MSKKDLQVYCFDLDGTLCEIKKGPKGLKEYGKALPMWDRIKKVNQLYDGGVYQKSISRVGIKVSCFTGRCKNAR